jgi:hypothetical protein
MAYRGNIGVRLGRLEGAASGSRLFVVEEPADHDYDVDEFLRGHGHVVGPRDLVVCLRKWSGLTEPRLISATNCK